MEFQILHAFPIQSQPRLDVRVFGVAGRRISIALLDFARASLIDFREHRPKWNAKNRALCPTPATTVSQWLGKFENFSGKFHRLFCKAAPKML
jgi:hypothetical protein